MKYDRTIVAYHGCDERVAKALLRGKPFRESQNDYDWLGAGIYFWEYGAARALRFAEDQIARRGKSAEQRPTVVGALLQLGNCFDLMDVQFTSDLKIAFRLFKSIHDVKGVDLPRNGGPTQDKLLRRRDCAVLNFYLQWLKESAHINYDTVRCGFVEGKPAFPGSGIREQSHIQIAVRNPACIIGVFTPTLSA